MDYQAEFSLLPGTPQEEEWLKERLETLSARETDILSAAFQRFPPESKADAINLLFTLDDHSLCYPASSYSGLGKWYLQNDLHLPDSAIPHADLTQLGELYEEKHPGLFIGDCYVEYPSTPVPPAYDGNGVVIPPDEDWSVKVKLSTSLRPEGVWLRLPDRSAVMGHNDEVNAALRELKFRSIENCTLEDARCALPELGDLMEQYSDPVELVNDGNNLGHILDEQGQGAPHFMERFAAALEYEGCHALRFALDIAQNLSCYEWVPSGEVGAVARRELIGSGVPEEGISSGAFVLNSYGGELLEAAGYFLTLDETGYIARNNREFVYDRSQPQKGGIEMQ